LDEKPSKSLSLAMRKLEEAARRAMVEGAGEKAAEYLSAEAAREVIMRELKDVMVSTTLGTKSEPNILGCDMWR
jgi:fatty acid-binding protein DegV